MIVHTIRRGQFLRSLRPPGDSSVPAHISQLQVGMEGHMVVQTSLEERCHREVRSPWRKHTLSTHSHAPCLNNRVLTPLPLPPPSQGVHSLHVYSVNGCLLSSFASSEQVTALHLVSDHVILGTMQGSLHIRDLHRCGATAAAVASHAALATAVLLCLNTSGRPGFFITLLILVFPL